ncbi:MAG: hypothetical protein MJZ37_00925 [Bacilli bacterium]|nr:hypothetical protein [Bacilli bacterium]
MQINLNKEESDFILKRLSGNYSTKTELNLADKLYRRIERAKTPIKPRSAKNKGMEWQKEICSFISGLIGIEYDQKSDDCLIHSRESGLSGTDVVLRGKAKELFPYSVECKNCKSISLPEWIRQADSNSDNGNWILFVKSPLLESKKVVIMPMESFEKLFQKSINT